MYKARLTGESLLLFEMQSIAELLLQGKTWNEIKEEVIEDNLFQYEKISTIKKRFGLVKRRFSYLKGDGKKLLVSDPTQGKVLTLYAICRDSLLFFDFLRLVLNQKIVKNDLVLYRTDIEAYLQMLTNQGTEAEGWTDKTTKKLHQVIMKILKDADIVDGDRISVPYISSNLREYLESVELGSVFISYMGS